MCKFLKTELYNRIVHTGQNRCRLIAPIMGVILNDRPLARPGHAEQRLNARIASGEISTNAI